MAKRKLRNFAELETFTNVIQHPYYKEQFDHPLKGKWHQEFFHNSLPITLELGCGKGEYSVGLAIRHPERNYLGVDIKGNRIWRGAKTGIEDNIPNIAFLRTEIEHLNNFFLPGEVDEIWITFPDPQPNKSKAHKRLTSAEFLDRYRKILRPGGLVHLKTDSAFLFESTMAVIESQNLPVLRISRDIDTDFPGDELLQIRTYYELKFRHTGVPINYVAYTL